MSPQQPRDVLAALDPRAVAKVQQEPQLPLLRLEPRLFGAPDQRERHAVLRVHHHLDERVATPPLEPQQVLRLGVSPLAEHEDALARASRWFGAGGATLTIATVAGHRQLLDRPCEIAEERDRTVPTLEIPALEVLGLARLVVGERVESGGALRVLLGEPDLVAS
jgi:hypothetical protein